MTTKILASFAVLSVLAFLGYSFWPPAEVAVEPTFGASGDIVFNDTFTETSTTDLTAHTPDTGVSWVAVDTRAITLVADGTGDHAQAASTATSRGQTAVASTSASYPANYQLKLNVKGTNSSTSDDYFWIYARYQGNSANNSYYATRFDTQSTIDPNIYRGDATSNTALISLTSVHDTSVGAWYSAGNNVTFELIGSDLIVFGGLSGEESARTYATDTGVTAGGRAGIGLGAYWFDTGGDTDVNAQVDNFSVSHVGDTVSTWRSPATTGETNNDFTNPTNAYASDDSDVTINWDTGVGTYAQDYGDFGHSCSGDTIRGISVRLEGMTDSSGWHEYAVALSNDNGSTWSAEKTIRIEDMDVADWYVVVGRADSLWGLTWTCTDIADTDLRVKIRAAARETTTVDDTTLDHVTVRVVSDAGGGSPPPAPPPPPNFFNSQVI